MSRNGTYSLRAGARSSVPRRRTAHTSRRFRCGYGRKVTWSDRLRRLDTSVLGTPESSFPADSPATAAETASVAEMLCRRWSAALEPPSAGPVTHGADPWAPPPEHPRTRITVVDLEEGKSAVNDVPWPLAACVAAVEEMTITPSSQPFGRRALGPGATQLFAWREVVDDRRARYVVGDRTVGVGATPRMRLTLEAAEAGTRVSIDALPWRRRWRWRTAYGAALLTLGLTGWMGLTHIRHTLPAGFVVAAYVLSVGGDAIWHPARFRGRFGRW